MPSEVQTPQNVPQATIPTQTINPLPSGLAGSSTSSQKTLQKRKREDQGTSLRQTKKLKKSSQGQSGPLASQEVLVPCQIFKQIFIDPRSV
ncbi:hypothetical protein CPB84DRAFT_1799584, partial [Gymnopilus junonius]